MTITNRSDIAIAIQQTLRTLVNGAGDYTSNLTNKVGSTTESERVRIGSFSAPPSRPKPGYPVVSIADAGTNGQQGRNSMRKFTNNGSWLITAWVWSDARKSDQRIADAAAAERDIKQALTSNMQLRTDSNPGGSVARFVLTSITYEGSRIRGAGQADDLDQIAVVQMVLTAIWDDNLPAQITGSGIE